MVQGLWDRQVDAIINVKLGDADADSLNYEPMAALLPGGKRSKRTSTVSTFMTNGNIFRRLFSQWTEC